MSFQPWLDFEHHHYWVTEKDSNVVAILVLTSSHHKQYKIKNDVSFLNAPCSTSGMIIFHTLSDIQDECDSIDDTDRKLEDGAYMNKGVDVMLIIEENSGH